nr:UDP-glucose--hexose-1-phosphate uridylyltransferase [bacterium]
MPTMQEAAGALERLLRFALEHGLIEACDIDYSRNALMDLFGLTAPGADDGAPLSPTARPMLDVLVDYAAQTGLLPTDTAHERARLDTRAMGILTPRPTQVERTFMFELEQGGAQQATDWFYALCRASNYIRVDDIEKNILWQADSPYGALDITINLSRPERDPKEIEKLKNAPKSGYPACMLCKENVGFAGDFSRPARQNLRTIPLHLLEGETWYFQYSPYLYYDEHCIVFKDEHTPMHICRQTLERILAFLSAFPHYFLGSNAGLPIVGGSILNHDHFQGGRADFPMARAPLYATYRHAGHPAVHCGAIRWPVAGVRLSSPDSGALLEAASALLQRWECYDDPARGILSHTGDTPHNAITPIGRRRGDAFELDLVLRNNRTDEAHPLGIFHPHAAKHHIKKENIGLIEVMGRFILPGRLAPVLPQMAQALMDTGLSKQAARWEQGHPLMPHRDWLLDIQSRRGPAPDMQQAQQWVRQEIGRVCMGTLEDAGVFKDTPDGRAGLHAFMACCGWQVAG